MAIQYTLVEKKANPKQKPRQKLTLGEAFFMRMNRHAKAIGANQPC